MVCVWGGGEDGKDWGNSSGAWKRGIKETRKTAKDGRRETREVKEKEGGVAGWDKIAARREEVWEQARDI